MLLTLKLRKYVQDYEYAVSRSMYQFREKVFLVMFFLNRFQEFVGFFLLQ